MKKNMIKAIFCLLMFAFAGMFVFTRMGGNFQEQEQIINENLNHAKSIQYYSDDNTIIYLSFPDNIATFSRYYIDTDKVIDIGSIPQYYLSTGKTCYINGILYFYVAVGNSETATNKLFSIDLNTNQIIECNSTIDTSLPGLLAYKMGNCVVTLKNIVNKDGSIFTFFDIYDTETRESKIFHCNQWFSYNIDGTAIFAFYADDEHLYSFQDEYSDDGSVVKTMLHCFDSSFKETSSVELDGDIRDFIKGGRIKEAYLHDNIIFLQNTSSFSYLGIIEGDKIDSIFENEQYLQVTYNYSNDEMEEIFYTRRASSIIWYDEESGVLFESSLPVDSSESVRLAILGSNHLIYQCYVEESPDNTLYHLYSIGVNSILNFRKQIIWKPIDS